MCKKIQECMATREIRKRKKRFVDLVSGTVSVSAAATSVSSAVASATAASASVAATAAVSASAETSSTASAAAEWSAFLFVCFAGDVVFLINLGCYGLFCHVEFAVFAYVQTYVTFEQGDIAVFNADGVTFVNLGNVVIPKREVDDACFVTY